MNSEIDSSEAKAAGEGLFDDLTSFASTAGASDLGGVGDSSTTSFNWAFTTGERINLDCKPLAENRRPGLRGKNTLEREQREWG